jgi:hypothetical protein
MRSFERGIGTNIASAILSLEANSIILLATKSAQIFKALEFLSYLNA